MMGCPENLDPAFESDEGKVGPEDGEEAIDQEDREPHVVAQDDLAAGPAAGLRRKGPRR